MIDDAYWAKFPDHLSISDLAKITRKSDQTVWRWLAQGVIPAHQVGRAWIVYREVFQHRLEEPDVPYLLPLELLERYGEELKIDEYAEILGKAKDTLYLWLADGTIPGRRLGTRWLLYKHDVVQLLERTSNQASADSSGK